MSKSKLGRNDPCHCGSGKKYKKCCALIEKNSGMIEVASVGSTWINQHVSLLIQNARHTFKTPLSDSLQKALIEICDVQGISTIESIDLPAQGKKGRQQVALLREALQLSLVEPFEVIEVRRGFDLKVHGKVSGKTYVIAQPEDAQLLEPMEWILGRVLLFQNRAYLLDQWTKFPFKKRRWLKSLIEERWQQENDPFSLPTFDVEADLEEDVLNIQDNQIRDWLKAHSGWFFEKLEEVSLS